MEDSEAGAQKAYNPVSWYKTVGVKVMRGFRGYLFNQYFRVRNTKEIRKRNIESGTCELTCLKQAPVGHDF